MILSIVNEDDWFYKKKKAQTTKYWEVESEFNWTEMQMKYIFNYNVFFSNYNQMKW